MSCVLTLTLILIISKRRQPINTQNTLDTHTVCFSASSSVQLEFGVNRPGHWHISSPNIETHSPPCTVPFARDITRIASPLIVALARDQVRVQTAAVTVNANQRKTLVDAALFYGDGDITGVAGGAVKAAAGDVATEYILGAESVPVALLPRAPVSTRDVLVLQDLTPDSSEIGRTVADGEALLV